VRFSSFITYGAVGPYPQRPPEDSDRAYPVPRAEESPENALEGARGAEKGHEGRVVPNGKLGLTLIKPTDGFDVLSYSTNR